MFLLLMAYIFLIVCYLYVFCKAYFLLYDYEEEMRNVGKLNLDIQTDIQDKLNLLSKQIEELKKLTGKDK